MSVFTRKCGDRDIWRGWFLDERGWVMRQLPPHVKASANMTIENVRIKLEVKVQKG